MTNALKNIAVIGAGPMGLLCAYRLLQKGHKVSVFERDDRLGGMSASFDLDGLKIERFYHFICSGDTALLSLLDELGLAEKLCWRKTRMGFYCNGKLYDWGNPLHLLAFPELGLISKLRYALHILYAKNIRNWRRLDREYASDWLRRWLGEKGYNLLWEHLLRLKYHELHTSISAAWIAARIQRLARSRQNIFTERLGYLEGGSDTLLDRLEEVIKGLGGEIFLNAEIQQLRVENERMKGVIVNDEAKDFDLAVSTIPLSYVPQIVPALSPAITERIRAIKSIGVVCVIMKLERPISDNFWTNINDSRMEIAGLIEYTNLYRQSDNVIYVPYYMPHHHPKYSWSDAQFIGEVTQCLAMINPDFSPGDIKSAHVSRYAHAQPVCTPHFFEALPAVKTNIHGFLMADTAYYYPEDRSISESLRLGNQLAETACESP